MVLFEQNMQFSLGVEGREGVEQMKDTFWYNEKEYEHHEFEATGTRYMIHKTRDRFGGWLIIWTDGDQCWRLYDDNELKFLFGKYNYYDTLNVAEYFKGVI